MTKCDCCKRPAWFRFLVQQTGKTFYRCVAHVDRLHAVVRDQYVTVTRVGDQ